MEIFTIGFTRRSAKSFFTTLERAGIERVVDVRRNNTSQLAGFSKRDDLAWFAERILGAAYEHRPEAAPSQALLTAWRNDDLDWEDYARQYRSSLGDRKVEELFPPADFHRPTVLLCSEREPDRCHRLLLAEYLDQHWGEQGGEHTIELGGEQWGEVTVTHL